MRTAPESHGSSMLYAGQSEAAVRRSIRAAEALQREHERAEAAERRGGAGAASPEELSEEETEERELQIEEAEEQRRSRRRAAHLDPDADSEEEEEEESDDDDEGLAEEGLGAGRGSSNSSSYFSGSSAQRRALAILQRKEERERAAAARKEGPSLPPAPAGVSQQEHRKVARLLKRRDTGVPWPTHSSIRKADDFSDASSEEEGQGEDRALSTRKGQDSSASRSKGWIGNGLGGRSAAASSSRDTLMEEEGEDGEDAAEDAEDYPEEDGYGSEELAELREYYAFKKDMQAQRKAAAAAAKGL